MKAGAIQPVAIAGLILLAGCGGAVIEGEVHNVRGEQLPGVAVRVSGTENQDLSDARGAYRVPYDSARESVRFSKTGYTSGEIRLSDARGRLRPEPVTLWQLPASAGVFLFEHFQYEPATWIVPEQFLMAEGHVAYGTQREPTASTSSPRPVIICFNTPRYDALLSRLRREEAKLPSKNSGAFEVWTAAGTVKVNLVPVDQPDGLLLRLHLAQPLEPGVYALHWGALDGYATLERRVFMFEVLAPPDPVETIQEGPTAIPVKAPEEPISKVPQEAKLIPAATTPETTVAPPPSRSPPEPSPPELFPEDAPELNLADPPAEKDTAPKPFDAVEPPH